MIRTDAIARISTALPKLSDEQMEILAELIEWWADGSTPPPESSTVFAAIARGMAQAQGGKFASDEAIDAAYARFR